MRRRMLLGLAVLLVALPLIAAAAAVVVANTEWGRDRIAGLLLAATRGGPVEIRVARVTGPLPGRLGLVGLRLSDRDGEFAAFQRVELAWSPWALLRGVVAVDEVEIVGGAVERAPVLPPDPAPPPDAGGLPSLAFPAPPVALRLDGLRVADLRLGAALAGRQATVSAELSASLTGSAAAVGGWLEVRAVDGAARVDIDLSVDPSNGTLRAGLRAREPQGGLLAGLLGLEDRPALDLALSGAGTLADWKGRLAGGFGPGAGIDLAIVVAGDPRGTAVAVDGTVDPERLVPPELRGIAGGSAAIGATVRLAPDGAVAVERIALSTHVATLAGTAALDAAGTPVAADLRLEVPSLRPFSELAATELGGGVAARMRLTEGGRAATVVMNGRIVVDGRAIDGLSVEATASAGRSLASLPPELSWRIEASAATPTLPDLDLPGLLGPTIALTAEGRAAGGGAQVQADRVVLRSDAGWLEAAASLADGRRIEAAGTLAVPDIGRFSTLAGRPLAGSATLAFDGSVSLDQFDLSAVVDAAADGLGLGDPALDRLVGPAPGLAAGITLDGVNRLGLHGLLLDLAAAGATGDATIDLDGGALDGRFEATAPNLAAIGRAVGADLAGAGAAVLALGGTLDAPGASASWRLAPLAAGGVRLAELSGSATAGGLPARPAGRIDVKAVAGGETVTLGADYALAGDRLRVDGIALDGAGLRGRGRAAVDLSGPLVEGELSLAAVDLGRIATVAGAPVDGGALDLSIGLTSRGGQGATISGSLRDLSLDGGAIRVASVALSGEGRDLLRRPAGALRAEIGSVRRGEVAVVEQALLTLRGDGSTATVAASLDGGTAIRYRASAAASADLRRQPLRISVDRLDAEVDGAVIRLERPTLVTLGRSPRVDDLALAVDGGRITGGGRIDPADLDAALAVRGLPAGLARLADPTLKLSGGVDADLAIRGPIGDPTARLAVAAPAVRATRPTLADLPPLKASAELQVEARRLTVAADLSVGQGAKAALRAEARLIPGSAGRPPTLDERAPVAAALDLEAALDQLSAYLPLEGGRLGGQAELHVRVAGTASDPRVEGTATLSDGVVEQPTAGLYLRDVQLAARGQGEQLVIDRLTGSAVSGGSFGGSGGISLDVGDGMPADLRLTASRLTAVDTDEATVVVDADLTFTGRIPDYRLAGTVTVQPSEIRIPDQLPPSVVDLPVTEVRGGTVIRSPEPPPAQGEGGAPVVLDLRIAVPGQVFVRGRGLDSEWGGELAVAGRLDAPKVDGRIEVRRGQFSGLGRTFGFERGRVQFDGGPPADPDLDMVLSTEVAEIVAKVVVSGHAGDPKIALTSEPALPEEEILSRILFGSPRAQLSPLQALKLAQSAAVLSGRLGSGGGITDRVRETLGVDTLNLDAGGEGTKGASLSVGKYVAPGVFLKLQQGLGSSGSKAVVEVELTDNISVETDVGADSQSSVGVNWKVDY